MAQTPTIQDILSSYQEGVGAGGTNTALLLQALRNRQIRAGEEDKQTAKSFHSGGKAFLSGSKHARDFQIAQRVKPDLTFREFLRDPATSAKYLKQGTELIAEGKRAPLGFGEAYNPFSKRHLMNPNMQKLSDLAQKDTSAKLSGEIDAYKSAEAKKIYESELHSQSLQDLLGAKTGIGEALETAQTLMPPIIPEPEFVPPQQISMDPYGVAGSETYQGAIEQLKQSGYSGDLSSIRQNYGKPGFPGKPLTRDITSQSLDELLGTGQPSFLNQSSVSGGGVNIPAMGKSVYQANLSPEIPLQATPSMDSVIRGAGSLPPATDAATSALETTGEGAGGALSAFGVGKGLFDTFGATNTEDRQEAMFGAGASAVGVVNPPLGLALGILSMLAKRR